MGGGVGWYLETAVRLSETGHQQDVHRATIDQAVFAIHPLIRSGLGSPACRVLRVGYVDIRHA